MIRFTLRLRAFAVLLFGGILIACTQPKEGTNESRVTVCPPGKNIAVCFFEEAEHQGENYGVPLETTPIHKLIDAFKGALVLPLEELRAKRYADSAGEHDKWAFHELLSAYFVSDSSVTPKDEGFYKALKEPEAMSILDGWLGVFERRYEDMVRAKEYGTVVCAPSENIAVCFFAEANFQGDHSPEPVRDAIKDALTLPLEELRTKRYADYSMTPNQWTFEEVIGGSFSGGALRRNGDIISSNSEGFIEAVKQPEAISVLENLLVDFEESVREYEELEAFRQQNKSGD